MNTLLVYGTKHGTAGKCAAILSQKLAGKVDVCNLKTGKVPELSQYDRVIIGGSIYIGGIQKEVKEFCSKNLNVLKGKKVGLFICGMQNAEVIKTQLGTSFPPELLESSIAAEHFGGEFIFKNLDFLERLIVKKVSKIDKDTSNILEENINRLAQLMNNS